MPCSLDRGDKWSRIEIELKHSYEIARFSVSRRRFPGEISGDTDHLGKNHLHRSNDTTSGYNFGF
jgi:hypothetical protein